MSIAAPDLVKPGQKEVSVQPGVQKITTSAAEYQNFAVGVAKQLPNQMGRIDVKPPATQPIPQSKELDEVGAERLGSIEFPTGSDLKYGAEVISQPLTGKSIFGRLGERLRWFKTASRRNKQKASVGNKPAETADIV